MLWIAVEKAQKSLPTAPQDLESSASLQLKLGLPPKNWFVARDNSGTLRTLYSARPYKGFIAAQRTPLAPLLSHRLSVNQAKNCVSESLGSLTIC
jgi:hypothetical protein